MESLLSSITYNILNFLDKILVVGGAFLHISEASDKVLHKRLICKLQQNYISGVELNSQILVDWVDVNAFILAKNHTFLDFIVDQTLSGESMTLHFLHKTDSRFRFFYRQNKFLNKLLRRLLCNVMIQLFLITLVLHGTQI